MPDPVFRLRGRSTPLPKAERVLRSVLRALVRRYPINSGVMRIVNLHLLKALTRSPEIALVRLRNGPRIWVDISDYCGRPIYY